MLRKVIFKMILYSKVKEYVKPLEYEIFLKQLK